MKLKILSVILITCMLFSLFTVNGFAVTEIRLLTFRDVPSMFASGMNVAYFTPATIDINRGYDYLWMVEKYDSQNNYMGAYWPDNMDDLALRFYRMSVPEVTAEDIAPIKTAFGTTFDGDYNYVFIALVMLNNGYAFTDNLGIRYYLTNGLSETFVQEESSATDFAYIAYNMPELGDVDCDGNLSVSDALAVLHYCVGKVEFNVLQTELGDVDESVGIDAKDALSILHMSVGKISKFPNVY
ncbi:MAG: hypothetical protein IJ944_03255 [Clostridia bacterium]|nr:hypothetical protein [Clostridia bacterium]